jgi:hypothetical protein
MKKDSKIKRDDYSGGTGQFCMQINKKVRFDAWMMAFMKGRELEWLEFESGNFDPVQWKSAQ